MKKLSNIDLIELLLQCKKQDNIAQREIYDYFVISLYNTSLRILNDRITSEDAVQNTFIKAFDKIHQFNLEKGSFSSWIHRICVNESISIIRKKKQVEDLGNHTYIPDEKPTMLDTLDAEYILEAMQKLPETQRVIFNLYEVEGYTHKEIGDLIGISESSSRTYLMRAKTKLRAMLSRFTEVKTVI